MFGEGATYFDLIMKSIKMKNIDCQKEEEKMGESIMRIEKLKEEIKRDDH